MIKFQVLQEIANDPPADKLELYSRLCAAHSYTFGDLVTIAKVYEATMSPEPASSVFVRTLKPTGDYDAILATCFHGVTTDGVTAYTKKLGIYLRHAGSASSYVDILNTVVLGKKLGIHLAEAMGYEDYLIITPTAVTIINYLGATSAAQVQPLIVTPGVSVTADNYVDCTDETNFNALLTVFQSASDKASAAVTINGLSANPPAWFSCNDTFDVCVMPLGTYLTDDQCWATVNDNINTLQQEAIDGLVERADADELAIASLGQGYGTVVEAVGALSVFGNSVKDVTERYKAMAQYIPRP